MLTCCYGMECDVLGLLPRHLFQQLLTMHDSWNKGAALNDSASLKGGRDTVQYAHSAQIEKNYHTLCTIPHHYEDHESGAVEADAVELATSASAHIQVTQICGMCGLKICGDSHALECGHEFHTQCMEAQRPMNFSCPECETDVDDGSTIHGIGDSDDDLHSVHGDVRHLGRPHPVEAKLQLL